MPDTSENDRLIARSRHLRRLLSSRRSVRSFSTRPVPEEAVADCIAAAASAPSGANCQPWTFVLVGDPAVKRAIRLGAEEVERAFYRERITEEHREKLRPLGTDAQKPFLEEAPYLICVFMQAYGLDERGERAAHYYPNESVGLATGFLLAALHQTGLGTLTYTPAPMTFLRDLLGRPANERPYMIVAVGHPAEGYEPPHITRKGEEEYLVRK